MPVVWASAGADTTATGAASASEVRVMVRSFLMVMLFPSCGALVELGVTPGAVTVCVKLVWIVTEDGDRTVHVITVEIRDDRQARRVAGVASASLLRRLCGGRWLLACELRHLLVCCDVDGLARVLAVSVARGVACGGEPGPDLVETRVNVSDIDVAKQATVAVSVLVRDGQDDLLEKHQVCHVVAGSLVSAVSLLGGVDPDHPNLLPVAEFD